VSYGIDPSRAWTDGVDVLELRGTGATHQAHVQYHALYDEGGDQQPPPPPAGTRAQPPLLREWIDARTLAPPPPPPPPNWQRGLKWGDAAEAQHEGGWWAVSVVARVPGNARLKEPARFVVEASGYGVRRTVEAHELRPRCE
jgi:hypothetical protein